MQTLLVDEYDADETRARDTIKCTISTAIQDVVFSFIHPACIIFATGSIILACWWNGMSNFYAWHVLLTGIGFHLLMPTGISLLGGHRLGRRATRSTRKTIHWIVQSAAGACVLTGTVLQYINREMKHKHHLVSVHSIVGLVAVVFVVVSLANGAVALFGWELRKYLKPLWSQRLHRAAGTVAFLVGMFALVCAYDKRIFEEHFSGAVRSVLVGATVLTALISTFGVLKKVYSYICETCTLCSNEDPILEDVQ